MVVQLPRLSEVLHVIGRLKLLAPVVRLRQVSAIRLGEGDEGRRGGGGVGEGEEGKEKRREMRGGRDIC